MPFKYKVVERCFREAKLLLPGQEFVAELAQPSRALEPADEETKKATDAKRAEYEAAAKQIAPVSQVESMELRLQNAELKAKLDALAAQVALVTQAQVSAGGDASGGKKK